MVARDLRCLWLGRFVVDCRKDCTWCLHVACAFTHSATGMVLALACSAIKSFAFHDALYGDAQQELYVAKEEVTRSPFQIRGDSFFSSTPNVFYEDCCNVTAAVFSQICFCMRMGGTKCAHACLSFPHHLLHPSQGNSRWFSLLLRDGLRGG
ncbi:hypothetical protein TRVL_08236 [Trypanosoma vivax]|nr:hypothetical protein TRVL_08236 [Trypanosoma vivax]